MTFEDPVEDLDECAVVLAALVDVAEAWIGRQFRRADAAAEGRPGSLAGVDDEPAAVARFVGVGERARRNVARVAGSGGPEDDGALHVGGDGPHPGVHEVDFDRLTLARALTVVERKSERGRCSETGGAVAHPRPHECRRVLRHAQQMHHARRGPKYREIEAAVELERSLRSPARDTHVNEAVVYLAQRLVVDAQPLLPIAEQVRDENVALGDQLAENVPSFVGLERDRERPFVAVVELVARVELRIRNGLLPGL